jgi:POT family proton-dependent oligopeptide transporter
VNIFIQNPDGSLKIEGADYFYFFAAIMFITAFLFAVFSRYYKAISYYQEEKIEINVIHDTIG